MEKPPQDDNELITLEIIHRYVEILDRYFGNVCELDLTFNFQKAYFFLDELLITGELQESSKNQSFASSLNKISLRNKR
ncbi:clathrin adaptor complex small chain-domain-containing protein [Zychaea mexicana]|uniref:clathrin adaptor complex small chain-domain-containing protein n=1 Tax=Zychaea mexicana TaxID=64656 RepID=UPI0022FF17F4|nr:clathrin adaptor complex small chain-domain-containing protein [Zychaea mexicana]KAI9494782.1 clathrin adaptor complex small chain-domain-containing protein [Zychaea mexicana]